MQKKDPKAQETCEILELAIDDIRSLAGAFSELEQWIDADNELTEKITLPEQEAVLH